MYTGSFTEIETPAGTLRVADVALHNANGDVIDLSTLSVTANVVFPATQNVSVVNFPATQNVAGSVSVLNFPATQNVAGAVNVGNFPATQNVAIVSGELATVNVANFPATQNVVLLGGSTANLSTSNVAVFGVGGQNVQQLLPANAARKQFSIYNGCNKTLLIAYANTVTNSVFSMPVAALGLYESKVGGYTGAVYAIFQGAPASGPLVSVTEFV